MNSVLLNGGFFVWISSFTLKGNLDIWADMYRQFDCNEIKEKC